MGRGSKEEPAAGERGARVSADGVSRATGEHRGRDLLGEPGVPGGSAGLGDAGDKDRGGHRVARHAKQRVEREIDRSGEVVDDRPEEGSVRAAVTADRVGGPVEVAVPETAASAGQRVGERHLRDGEVDAFGEPERLEERARERHRVHRAREVVPKPGEGDFAGGGSPTEPGVTFQDVDGEAGARERHRGREAVGPRPDDGDPADAHGVRMSGREGVHRRRMIWVASGSSGSLDSGEYGLSGSRWRPVGIARVRPSSSRRPPRDGCGRVAV